MSIFEDFWYRVFRRPLKLAVAEDAGQGDPVVLLHGIAVRGAIWRPLTKLLPKDRYRIVVPDLLGFGESPKPGWVQYTVDDHARAIVKTLKRQKLKGPVTIIGHSMGCLVAAHIAAKYPKLVKRLILYEPALFADAPEDYPKHTKRKQRYFAFFGYLATHPQLAATQGHVLWRVAKRLTGFALTEERWTPFERSLRNTIMQQTAYDELHAISIPTDIIYGRLDFVVIRTDVKRMLQANPNIRLHLVTQMHDVNPRAAKYIKGVLEGKQPARRMRKRA